MENVRRLLVLKVVGASLRQFNSGAINLVPVPTGANCSSSLTYDLFSTVQAFLAPKFPVTSVPPIWMEVVLSSLVLELLGEILRRFNSHSLIHYLY